jgi:hypothetical protein
MNKKLIIMDELKTVSPQHAAVLTDFILTRPGVGKSRLMEKAIKRINKRRKKQGLKKIKLKNFKLKVPKGWKLLANA